MTVPVIDPFNQHVALGGELTFSYDWITNAEEDLNVFRKKIDEEPDLLVLDVDYTVQGAGNELGGTITPVGAESPTIGGDIWTIVRETAVKRASDVPPAGDITPEIFNNQLDYITDFGQDRHHQTLRSLQLNPGLNQTLDPLIPELTPDKALVVREISTDVYAMGLSDVVPGGLQRVEDDPDPTLGGVLDTNGFSINHSEGAEVNDAAGIVNIWAGDGNTVPVDAAVITDFSAAPRIGATRDIILTSDVNILGVFGITLPGGLTVITGKTGDRFTVYADSLIAFTIKDFEAATGLALIRQGVVSKTLVVNSLTTFSATIPIDDTKPQITEGFEVIAFGLTPKFADGLITLDVAIFGSPDTQDRFTVALFEDTDVDAKNIYCETVSAGDPHTSFFRFHRVSTDTMTHSWSLRLGTPDGSQFTLGGVGGSQLFGGILPLTMILSEWGPGVFVP